MQIGLLDGHHLIKCVWVNISDSSSRQATRRSEYSLVMNAVGKSLGVGALIAGCLGLGGMGCGHGQRERGYLMVQVSTMPGSYVLRPMGQVLMAHIA
jgi:hypothetical protein